MTRVPQSAHGSTAHERLIGHNPAVLERWLALEGVFFSSPTFTPELREQVRRALSEGNRCEYCIARAGPPDPTIADERTRTAVAFAGMVGADHRDVMDSHFEILREQFTDSEIAELLAFMSFISGSQMFGAMMALKAADLPGSTPA